MPSVAVSACLLGEKVRYDGGDRRLPWLVEILSGHCHLQPICPETAAGLGVPRPPVRLVIDGEGLRALGVDDVSLDVTEPLQQAADRLLDALDQVDGLILKSRSPSCAVADAPRFTPAGGDAGVGAGLFASRCRRRYPDLPIIDEQGLASEAGKVGFLIQVFRYRCRRLREAGEPLS